MPQVFSGTRVLRCSDSSCVLFSQEEFSRVFGRGFDPATDVVLVMNGDGNSSGAHVDGCQYFGDSKSVYATFDRSWYGLMRINYVVVLGGR